MMMETKMESKIKIEEYLDNLRRESELGRIHLVEHLYNLIKKEAEELPEQEKRLYVSQAEIYQEEGYKRWIGTTLLRIADSVPYGYYEETYSGSLETVIKIATEKNIDIPKEITKKITKVKEEVEEVKEEIKKYFPLARMVPKYPVRKYPGFVF